MPKKIKLIFFLLSFLLLAGICFFVFREKVFAPQKILIINSDAITEVATESLRSDPVATSAPDSASNKQPEDKSEKTIQPKTVSDANAKNQLAKKLSITKKLVSWGFSTASNRKIDTIIIHSSYNALGGDVYDVNKLISEYQEYGVAPHYLIDREGKIYLLVEEENIAYHAGESKTPDGRSQVNNFSLGIEMMNTKEDNFTFEQYDSLESLLSNLKSQYPIKYVLGHDDIAPGRKTDPWNFEWNKIK